MERPLNNRREWDIARGSRIDGAFRAKNGTLRRLSAGPALWSKTRRHREFNSPIRRAPGAADTCVTAVRLTRSPSPSAAGKPRRP